MEQLIQQLRAYNEVEQIYWQYQRVLADEGQARADAFIQSLGAARVQSLKLIVPDKLQQLRLVHFSDAEYFDSARKRSVNLVKHNRFTPLFFHSHTFFEIFYVLEGQCQHTVDDRTQVLKEGDLCLLSPDLLHAIFVDDDSLVINILIRRDAMEAIFFNTIRGDSLVAHFFLNSIYIRNYATYLLFQTADNPLVRNQILEMYLEQSRPDAYSDQIISSMLMMLFVTIARHHPEAANQADLHMPQGREAQRLLQYILTHFDTITLKALAHQLSYSVPHCSKYVRQLTGRTFSELVRRIRFQKAENYLLNTSLPIARISELIGYGNPENFTRAFKKEYKVSPAQFRQDTRKELLL